MLPKEERAVLLTNKIYFDPIRRMGIDRIVAAQKALTSFLAYGYNPNYLQSAINDLKLAQEYIGDDDADTQV
jgi:hypothetical protein